MAPEAFLNATQPIRSVFQLIRVVLHSQGPRNSRPFCGTRSLTRQCLTSCRSQALAQMPKSVDSDAFAALQYFAWARTFVQTVVTG